MARLMWKKVKRYLCLIISVIIVLGATALYFPDEMDAIATAGVIDVEAVEVVATEGTTQATTTTAATTEATTTAITTIATTAAQTTTTQAITIDDNSPTAEIDRLLAQWGNTISVYYENLSTGFIYRHNANREYFGASLTKALLALMIYQMAEQGEASLDSVHSFTQADYRGGSGVIRHRYSVGATFTLRRLLELNLSYSDNISTMILVRTFGIDSYRRFVASVGGNPALVRERVMNSQLTANEAGIFARAIYAYLESEGRYSEEFRRHLLNNQFHFLARNGSDYPVASKTGWTDGRAWHDMAIVYAESPFILVVMSARTGFTEQNFRDFNEILRAFERFNGNIYEIYN